MAYLTQTGHEARIFDSDLAGLIDSELDKEEEGLQEVYASTEIQLHWQ